MTFHILSQLGGVSKDFPPFTEDETQGHLSYFSGTFIEPSSITSSGLISNLFPSTGAAHFSAWNQTDDSFSVSLIWIVTLLMPSKCVEFFPDEGILAPDYVNVHLMNCELELDDTWKSL